jgi:hypothetical protein
MFRRTILHVDYFGEPRNRINRMWIYHDGYTTKTFKVNLNEEC